MYGAVFGEKDWRGQYDHAGAYHVLPNNDLAEHDLKWNCACSPVFVAAQKAAGWWSWIYEHWAFDRREEFEGLDAK